MVKIEIVQNFTLKTLAWSTCPKPECVACRLLRAFRMSPSAVKIMASNPSGE